MALTGSRLEQLLSNIIERDGNSTYVENALNNALEAMATGNGVISVLTNGTRNGKSYTLAISADPAELALACTEVLKSHDSADGNPVFTVASFENTIAQ